MSWQATSWAGMQSVTKTPTEQLVLVILANYAGENGQNAFPSVARLSRETRLSERAVQKTLRRLEEMGLIRQGNQKIAEAHIDRPDKRPVVYDLNLSLTELPPVSTPDGVNVVHPAGARGESDDANGVNLATERGERGAPDPSLNHQKNPSARAPAREGAQSTGNEPRHAQPAVAASKGSEGRIAAPAMTEGERRRMWHQAFLLDWLEGVRPMATAFREIGVDEGRAARADAAAIEETALAMPATYLRGVAGLVRWAEGCLAGDTSLKPPIASVGRLMRLLADPATRALMARRLALLDQRLAALADDPPAEDEIESAADPPVAA